MDRNDWLLRISEPEWKTWMTYLQAADQRCNGNRTSWALNILEEACERCDCSGHPENLPSDAKVLRAAMEDILQSKSPQIQSLGISLVRSMLEKDPRCEHLMAVLPRYRRKETVNRITRQCRVVFDDALPKNIASWVADLFREIMDHEASINWRTSKSANQNLHMIHRFLRCSGLLDFTSLPEFHNHLKTMGSEDLTARCREFTDKFCATNASARRYLGVFNHLFHRVYAMWSKPVVAKGRKRKIVSLREIDDQLSQSTAGSSSNRRGNGKENRDYFDQEELERIRRAAESGSQRIRDSLIIYLLETTGLRRMGVLNILVTNVADRGGETGRYVALQYGKTLTKGSKWHKFPMQVALRTRIEDWLNTSEADGGRPRGPSPFLFPSNQIDNGQMSTTTLDRIFKDVCKRAGLGSDSRCHLHAMRHSCAHSLSKQGNSTKQISLVLGHSSTAVTEKVYLRDTVEHGCADLVVPSHWTPIISPAQSMPPQSTKEDSSVTESTKNKKSTKTEKRRSTRVVAREMLEIMRSVAGTA